MNKISKYIMILPIIFSYSIGLGVLTFTLERILTSNASQNQQEPQNREITVQSKIRGNGNYYLPILKIGKAGEKEIKISFDMIEKIKNQSQYIEDGYSKDLFSAKLMNIGNPRDITIFFVSKGFPDLWQINLVDGSFPTKKQFIDKEKVIVITKKFAESSFFGVNPIGKTLIFEDGYIKKSASFKVIGIFESKNEYLNTDAMNENIGFSPSGAGYEILALPAPTEIYFMPKLGFEKIGTEEIQNIVLKDYGSTVSVNSFAKKSNFYEQESNANNIFLILFSLISLLISGINLMNYLFSNFSKQKAETGILLALGANKNSIFLDKIKYISKITFFSTIFSIFITLTISQASQKFNGISIAHNSPISLVLVLIISILVNFLCTVTFGVFPAIEASRVKISEAIS